MTEDSLPSSSDRPPSGGSARTPESRDSSGPSTSRSEDGGSNSAGTSSAGPKSRTDSANDSGVEGRGSTGDEAPGSESASSDFGQGQPKPAADKDSDRTTGLGATDAAAPKSVSTEPDPETQPKARGNSNQFEAKEATKNSARINDEFNSILGLRAEARNAPPAAVYVDRKVVLDFLVLADSPLAFEAVVKAFEAKPLVTDQGRAAHGLHYATVQPGTGIPLTVGIAEAFDEFGQPANHVLAPLHGDYQPAVIFGFGTSTGVGARAANGLLLAVTDVIQILPSDGSTNSHRVGRTIPELITRHNSETCGDNEPNTALGPVIHHDPARSTYQDLDEVVGSVTDIAALDCVSTEFSNRGSVISIAGKKSAMIRVISGKNGGDDDPISSGLLAEAAHRFAEFLGSGYLMPRQRAQSPVPIGSFTSDSTTTHGSATTRSGSETDGTERGLRVVGAAGAVAAVERTYVRPDPWAKAMKSLLAHNTVVLFGAPGTGRRSGAMALVGAMELVPFEVLAEPDSLGKLGDLHDNDGFGYVCEVPAGTDRATLQPLLQSWPTGDSAPSLLLVVQDPGLRDAAPDRAVDWTLPDHAGVRQAVILHLGQATDEPVTAWEARVADADIPWSWIRSAGLIQRAASRIADQWRRTGTLTNVQASLRIAVSEEFSERFGVLPDDVARGWFLASAILDGAEKRDYLNAAERLGQIIDAARRQRTIGTLDKKTARKRANDLFGVDSPTQMLAAGASLLIDDEGLERVRSALFDATAATECAWDSYTSFRPLLSQWLSDLAGVWTGDSRPLVGLMATMLAAEPNRTIDGPLDAWAHRDIETSGGLVASSVRAALERGASGQAIVAKLKEWFAGTDNGQILTAALIFVVIDEPSCNDDILEICTDLADERDAGSLEWLLAVAVLGTRMGLPNGGEACFRALFGQAYDLLKRQPTFDEQEQVEALLRVVAWAGAMPFATPNDDPDVAWLHTQKAHQGFRKLWTNLLRYPHIGPITREILRQQILTALENGSGNPSEDEAVVNWPIWLGNLVIEIRNSTSLITVHGQIDQLMRDLSTSEPRQRCERFRNYCMKRFSHEPSLNLRGTDRTTTQGMPARRPSAAGSINRR
jgi:hypothetical protein